MQLTKAEKQLYIALVQFYIEHYPDNTKTDNGELYHEPPIGNAFGAMRRNMINLGLAVGVPDWSSLTVDAKLARQKLEKEIPATAPTLYILLAEWLYLFTSYDTPEIDYLPTTRQPFTVDKGYVPLMVHFVLNGYARKEHDLYVWTDKIAPEMRHNSQWTPDLEDVDDLAKQRRLTRAEAMVDGLDIQRKK